MSHPDAGSYFRYGSLPECLTHLDRRPATVLAGGTDLVLMRADGMVDRALDIIDIKDVASLRGITVESDGTISIGATTSLREVAKSAISSRNAVADGAGLIGGWQTRARGTIGGNICRASPAGDTLAGILVTGAELELASTAGSRLVPAHEFFTGPGKTVRQPNELLTRIVVPASGGGSAYVRFTYRRAMDLAVVGVAAHLVLTDGHCVNARIALCAAAARPLLAAESAAALIGTKLDDASVDGAAQLVMRTATPIDDGRASSAHRTKVLPVLAKRAIGFALERARGGPTNDEA